MRCSRWIPSREQVVASRWVRPIAHHLNDDRLWHLNRQSAARGVAIGLFFGLMLPFAQFLFAITTAVVLRGHIALAAGMTLITNPLTVPPIYWLAHSIGRWLLGAPAADRGLRNAEREAQQLGEAETWLEATWQWLQAAGAPLLVGLAVLACAAAVVGYVLVWLLWRERAAPDDERPPH